MRAYLTNPELATDAGKQLLELTVRIAADGLIEPAEIDELHTWLKNNKENDGIASIAYLNEILSRITADGVMDRDELIELHLAIERVIPTVHRRPLVQARKQRESAEREQLQKSRHAQREQKQDERKRLDEENARQRRLRHAFAKVAGVTFPNDDGSERQTILGKCKVGEQLILRHDTDNKYSMFAIEVLRANGEQIGHAPEYIAERIQKEEEAECKAIGVLKDLTGGSGDKLTRGANFVVFFLARDVTNIELQQYANDVFTHQGASRPRQLNLALLSSPGEELGYVHDRFHSRRLDLPLFPSPLPDTRKPWWKFW